MLGHELCVPGCTPASARSAATDIGEFTVHIGARVSAVAGPNDVLVSNMLRDLVIGSGLAFDDRGAHQLKRVPDQWHLFAAASGLRWVAGETHFTFSVSACAPGGSGLLKDISEKRL